MRIQRNFFIFFIFSAVAYFLFSHYVTFKYSQEHFAQDSYDQTHSYFKNIQSMREGASLEKTIASLPSKMKEISGDDAFLFYLNATTNTTQANAVGAIMLNQTKKLPADLLVSLDVNQHIQSLSIGGSGYLLALYPIYDASQNLIAYLGVLHSTDLLYKRFWEQSAFDFFLFFGFILVTSYLMQHYLKKTTSQVLQMRHLTKQYENLELQLDERTQEIHKAYESLENIHFQDSLTKLPNRFALLRDLRSFSSGVLVIFDIAKFNVINDTYGVDVGNQFLVAFSELMRMMSREKDITLYRVGSDEFVCISSKSMMEFQKWFSSVFERIEKEVFTFSDASIEISVQLHAGISDISEHCIENATLALGYAKKHQLEYFIYTESLQSLHKDKEDTAMMKVIKSAILDERVVPYFQAIVDKDGNINKYEALMRIRSNGKIVPPIDFLTVARRSKYYHMMTRIMIQKSLALFRDRSESVSLNLNMIDIKNTTTVMLILDELKKFPDASRVIFELVESESMESVSEVLNFISAIKAHGAKIAIDDFGTGYSNFSYLMEINPDFIKIDGSLVGSIDHDKQAFMIVKSIAEFTHALGIESIGEFVHNEAVFQKAKDLGVDAFQGNYFHLPHEYLLELSS
jgi:diguanylate cyclase (GGDEF)-like protein